MDFMTHGLKYFILTCTKCHMWFHLSRMQKLDEDITLGSSETHVKMEYK